jgi:hypothetical protein
MHHKKPLPGILVIFLDLLGIGAALGIFSLFMFVIPSGGNQPLKNIALFGTTPTATQPAETPDPAAATNDPAQTAATPAPSPTPASVPGDFSATFPSGEPDDENAVGTYSDDNLRISVSEHHTDDAVYFVADVWVRNILGFKTAFVGDKYKGGYELPSDTARKHSAILSLSGDCYRARNDGIVIRNGVLYRDTLSGDVCILYADGTMESYYESQFNLDAAVARGAYQGWSFGPKLIDNGQVPSSFNTSDAIMNHNPRSAIGYFAPGHYCLVYVDGRQADYSRGLTMEELSQTMIDLGCVDAYNLDGGQSSMMTFQGEVIGQPYKGGREISDILYFGGNDPKA